MGMFNPDKDEENFFGDLYLRCQAKERAMKPKRVTSEDLEAGKLSCDVFELVKQEGLVWHGLYNGRTGIGGVTAPPVGHSPDTYGDADWNVRVVDNKVKPYIMGHGGGTSVALAVCRAVANVRALREKRKEKENTVPVNRKLLRQYGVQI